MNDSTPRTYRHSQETINQLKRLKKYYNRSFTDIVEIAVSTLYWEMPDITPEDTPLLDIIKEKIHHKYGSSLVDYAASHGFTKEEFYRTIKSIAEGKIIRGFGSEDKNNKKRDNLDIYHATSTAQIAVLLHDDFGIKFNC